MSNKKRYRIPTAKPGELKLVYGKVDKYDDPDICAVYGDGAGHNGADGRLLFHVFGCERNRYMSREQDKSLIKELEERGYDITTIKFSIQKKSVGEK